MSSPISPLKAAKSLELRVWIAAQIASSPSGGAAGSAVAAAAAGAGFAFLNPPLETARRHSAWHASSSPSQPTPLIAGKNTSRSSSDALRSIHFFVEPPMSSIVP